MVKILDLIVSETFDKRLLCIVFFDLRLFGISLEVSFPLSYRAVIDHLKS